MPKCKLDKDPCAFLVKILPKTALSNKLSHRHKLKFSRSHIKKKTKTKQVQLILLCYLAQCAPNVIPTLINTKIVETFYIFILNLRKLVCTFHLQHISVWISHISSAGQPHMASTTIWTTQL